MVLAARTLASSGAGDNCRQLNFLYISFTKIYQNRYSNQNMHAQKKDKKPSCRQGRRAAAYTVPVAVGLLTFKVIQGR